MDQVDNKTNENDIHANIEPSRPSFDRYGFSGGKEYTDPKEEPRLSTRVLHNREMKWRSMCNNWESYWKDHHIQVRDRCRKGIPDSMRCEAWQRLCSSPMVLVARTKVIVNESRQDMNGISSATGITKSIFENSSSIQPKFSRRTSIITTSPSFRIKRSNAESRRRMILRKLYGDQADYAEDDPNLEISDQNGVVITPHWSGSITANSGAGCSLSHQFHHSGGLDIPPSCQSVRSNDVQKFVSTSESVVTPSSGMQDSTLTNSFHLQSSCDTTVSKSPEPRLRNTVLNSCAGNAYPVMSSSSPMCHPPKYLHLPPLAVSLTSKHNTTAPPYGYNTISNFNILRAASSTTATVGAPVVAAASSSSGGYASLSTDSGDGGCDIHGQTSNNSVHSASHDDQYSVASYLSSRSSSSSIFLRSLGRRLRRKPSSVNVLDEISNISLHGTLLMGDDNRATLMPPGDPDPVELYYKYCRAEGPSAACDQIRRDIDRQFPFHELFHQKGGHGQQSLYTLLKAYAVRYPEKGYCQGQAPLAAVLLMFMPEVDAFWTFNEICQRYLDAYYDDGLERVQIDAQILFTLLKCRYTDVYKFLKKYSVDPILIVLEWFLCVFTRTLPWSVVLRVLDMFFCEGKIVLFRVALVLLRRMFGTASQRKGCNGMDEILLRVRDVQSVIKNADEFIRETLRIRLTPRDLAQEAVRHSRQWATKKLAN